MKKLILVYFVFSLSLSETLYFPASVWGFKIIQPFVSKSVLNTYLQKWKMNLISLMNCLLELFLTDIKTHGNK